MVNVPAVAAVPYHNKVLVLFAVAVNCPVVTPIQYEAFATVGAVGVGVTFIVIALVESSIPSIFLIIALYVPVLLIINLDPSLLINC